MEHRDKVIFCLFFVSGFCSLLYQMVWIRLAYASFGILTSVLSILISVFMLGLAVGSWAGGRWISALTARSSLSGIYFYAISEFIIGTGAFLVPFFFSGGEGLLLSAGDMNSTRYISASSLVIVLSTIPFCFFMGTTFPTMMAFIKENDSMQNKSFGFLYLANVLGAMGGTLISALVMIELFGFKHTLLVAGCGNFTVAAVGILLGLKYPYTSVYDPTNDAPAPAAKQRTPLTPISISKGKMVHAILFTTGFTSMALEVIWFRAYTPVLKTQVYSFAYLLFTYLLSTSIGSFIYRKHIKTDSILSTQQLLGLTMVSVFLPVAINAPYFNTSAVRILVSIAPFCGLLGYLTPKLIDDYSQGQPHSAGYAYALNVLGCIIGPLFASYLLLPAVNSTLGMVIMGLPFFVFFIMHFRSTGFGRLGDALLLSIAGVLIVFFSISNNSPERKVAGQNGLVLRDHTATVIARLSGTQMELLVNGTHQGSKNLIAKVMAHLPMTMLGREPKSALVICFGMGVTFRSLMSWSVPTTAVDLVPSVIKSFGYFYKDANLLVKHSNARIVIDDGRRFLRRTRDRFDVITLDPPWPPEAAGSSLLYSEEFYRLAKTCLSRDGILQQWFPGGEPKMLQAVAASIRNSFPYVKIYRALNGRGFHFLASRAPLRTPTVREFISRLSETARTDLLNLQDGEAVHTNLNVLASKILAIEMKMSELPDSPPHVRITDDRPFNEYFALRRTFGWYKGTVNPPRMLGLDEEIIQSVQNNVQAAQAIVDDYLDIDPSGEIRFEILVAALKKCISELQSSKQSDEIVVNLGYLFGQYINNNLDSKWIAIPLKNNTSQLVVRHNASGTTVDPAHEVKRAIVRADINHFEKAYERLKKRIAEYAKQDIIYGNEFL